MSFPDDQTGTDASLTILIADDHWVVRESLKQVARGLDQDISVEEAASFDEALVVLERNTAINLLLVDLIMPGFKEMEGLRLIRSKYPSIPVVIVSVHDDPEYVMQAIQYGVVGYIPKSAGAEEIRLALSRVIAGEVAFPRDIISRVWVGRTDSPPEDLALENRRTVDLTKRECEILVRLGRGTSILDIADELEISRQTVRVHLGNAMRKLDLQTREAAIHYAVENVATLAALEKK